MVSIAESRYRWPWIVATVSMMAGVVLACVSMISFEVVRGMLDSISGDGSAEPYTPKVHQRLQTIFALSSAFCVLMASLCIGLRATKRGKVFEAKITRNLQKLYDDFGLLVAAVGKVLASSILLILFSVILACAVRLPFVQTPIRFDEAISWRDYAAKPFWLTIALYNDPNNHVFHNLISGLFMKWFGESLLVLRSVSLVAGILVVAISAVATKQIVLRSMPELTSTLASVAGCLVAVTICSNPIVNEFSIYARGYSLLMLTWLLSVVLLQHSITNRNSASWIGSIVFGALGMWTIPTMIYPIVATIAFWFLSRGRLVDMVAWLSSIAIVTVMLYSPILAISGPQAIIGNPYVKSLSIANWVEEAPSIIFSLREVLLGDIPATLQGVLLATVASACFYSLTYRSLNWKAIISFLAVAAVVFVQRVIPPERTWVWLAVPWSIAVGLAIPIVAMVNLRTPSSSKIASCVIALIVFAAPASNWFSGNRLQNSFATGPCPEASDAVSFLVDARRADEPIVVVCPASGTVDWYAKQAGIDPKAFDPPRLKPDGGLSPESIVVGIVNDGYFSQTVTSVLDAHESTRPWKGGVEELIWQGNTMSLYRVLLQKR
jgi:hypothetical protein